MRRGRETNEKRRPRIFNLPLPPNQKTKTKPKLSQDSIPRGVIDVHRCLSIKGAEDAINRPHAFELSTADEAMFFIADSDKEKEDWINAVGRAIVRHSRSLLEGDQVDYAPASLGGGG